MTEYAKMADLPLKKVSVADYDPLERQRDLQATIVAAKGGLNGVTPARTIGELLERFRFNREAMQAEFQEFLEFLPWKEWKTYPHMAETDALKDHEEVVTELKFEWIDMFHFWLNLGIALDATWEEAMEIFEAKQLENRRRQQEGY